MTDPEGASAPYNWPEGSSDDRSRLLVRAYWPAEPTGRWLYDELAPASEELFWVETTTEQSPLIEALCPAEGRGSLSDMRDGSGWPHRLGGSRPCCFLVPRQTQSAWAMQANFPVHHQWNAYSPFRPTGPHWFERLDELVSLRIGPLDSSS